MMKPQKMEDSDVGAPNMEESMVLEKLNKQIDQQFENLLQQFSKNLDFTGQGAVGFEGKAPHIPPQVHIEYRRELMKMDLNQLKKELAKKQRLLQMMKVAEKGEKTRKMIHLIEQLIEHKEKEQLQEGGALGKQPTTVVPQFDKNKNFVDHEEHEELKQWALKWNRPLSETERREFERNLQASKKKLSTSKTVPKSIIYDPLITKGKRGIKNNQVSRSSQLLSDTELEKLHLENENNFPRIKSDYEDITENFMHLQMKADEDDEDQIDDRDEYGDEQEHFDYD